MRDGHRDDKDEGMAQAPSEGEGGVVMGGEEGEPECVGVGGEEDEEGLSAFERER